MGGHRKVFDWRLYVREIGESALGTILFAVQVYRPSVVVVNGALAKNDTGLDAAWKGWGLACLLRQPTRPILQAENA